MKNKDEQLQEAAEKFIEILMPHYGKEDDINALCNFAKSEAVKTYHDKPKCQHKGIHNSTCIYKSEMQPTNVSDAVEFCKWLVPDGLDMDLLYKEFINQKTK